MTKENVNATVERYMNLVKIVQHSHFATADQEFAKDLYQEGCLGLWKAAQSYDESKGVKFETYASLLISHAMSDYAKKYNRINKRESQLLDCPMKDNDDETMLDRYSLEAVSEQDAYDDYDNEDALRAFADTLNATELRILHLYLNGSNYREIGEALGFSDQTASNRVKKLARNYVRMNQIKR